MAAIREENLTADERLAAFAAEEQRRFVQIAMAQEKAGGPALYALDGAGNVWRYDARISPMGGWRKLPMRRD